MKTTIHINKNKLNNYGCFSAIIKKYDGANNERYELRNDPGFG